MFNLFSTETKAYKSLNGKEFKEEYSKSKQPVLIDVRTAAEFASGSISNAKNIDVLSLDFKKQLNFTRHGKRVLPILSQRQPQWSGLQYDGGTGI